MTLKRVIIGVVAAFFLGFFVYFYFANLEQVDAVTEGVLIKSPYIFGEDGVDKKSYFTGRYFVWPSETLHKYKGVPFTVKEEFSDLPSADNVQMDFRIHTTMKLVQGKAPKVHDAVGSNWYVDRIQKPYRTIIRDKMMDLTADEMRRNIDNKLRALEGDGKQSIKTALEKLLAKSGVDYEVSGISIGGVTPPQKVLDEAERTAAQVQRKQTEMERKQAEISRKDAEEQRALADKKYISEMGLDPKQFVILEGYNAYRHAAEQCAAGSGCTMIVGDPGVPPVIPMK